MDGYIIFYFIKIHKKISIYLFFSNLVEFETQAFEAELKNKINK
jgi:hypothetical protein